MHSQLLEVFTITDLRISWQFLVKQHSSEKLKLQWKAFSQCDQKLKTMSRIFFFGLHQFYFRKICYLNNSNVSAPAPAPELFSYSWGLMSRAGQGLPPALHENLHPKQTIKGINFANKYFVAKCVMHLFSKTHWYWKINPYIPWCWPLYGYGSPWGDKSRSDRPDFTDI